MTLHHCVIRSQNFEATLQEGTGVDLLTVEDKDNKLPQNMGSDYPLMQHHMTVEWKPHSKPVRTAEYRRQLPDRSNPGQV
jgi:hypothetical protein